MTSALPFLLIAGAGAALLWAVAGPRVYRMDRNRIQIRQDRKRFSNYRRKRKTHERNNAPTIRVERSFSP